MSKAENENTATISRYLFVVIIFGFDILYAVIIVSSYPSDLYYLLHIIIWMFLIFNGPLIILMINTLFIAIVVPFLVLGAIDFFSGRKKYKTLQIDLCGHLANFWNDTGLFDFGLKRKWRGAAG